MVVCPAAADFAEALEWTAEVYRGAGALMQRARRHASASPTRAAGGRPSPPTSRRSRRWWRRSSAPASCPASRWRSRSTSPPREFGRGGRYTLGLEGRELDSDGMIELLLRWIETLSDRLDRGPAGRGRRGGLRALHARGRRRAAGRRRRFPGVAAAAGARRPRRSAPPTRCCSSPTSAAR